MRISAGFSETDTHCNHGHARSDGGLRLSNRIAVISRRSPRQVSAEEVMNPSRSMIRRPPLSGMDTVLTGMVRESHDEGE